VPAWFVCLFVQLLLELWLWGGSCSAEWLGARGCPTIACGFAVEVTPLQTRTNAHVHRELPQVLEDDSGSGTVPVDKEFPHGDLVVTLVVRTAGCKWGA
jgi:hypothetical protein